MTNEWIVELELINTGYFVKICLINISLQSWNSCSVVVLIDYPTDYWCSPGAEIQRLYICLKDRLHWFTHATVDRFWNQCWKLCSRKMRVKQESSWLKNTLEKGQEGWVDGRKESFPWVKWAAEPCVCVCVCVCKHWLDNCASGSQIAYAEITATSSHCIYAFTNSHTLKHAHTHTHAEWRYDDITGCRNETVNCPLLALHEIPVTVNMWLKQSRVQIHN